MPAVLTTADNRTTVKNKRTTDRNNPVRTLEGMTMELQDYITKAEGINEETRRQLSSALVSDPEGHELERLINEAPVTSMSDEVRNRLNIMHAVEFDTNY